MGTLLKGDLVNMVERAELRLTQAKEICKAEVKFQLERVYDQLKQAEANIIVNLDERCDKMVENLQSLTQQSTEKEVMEAFEDLVKNANVEIMVDRDLKIDHLLGVVCHNNVKPSDIVLDLESSLATLKTGSVVLLSIISSKPVFNNKFIKGDIQIKLSLTSDPDFKVKNQSKVVDDKEMKIRFKAERPGVYQVLICLFDHPVSNSPLMIPVDDDIEDIMARSGFVSKVSGSNHDPLPAIVKQTVPDDDGDSQQDPTLQPKKTNINDQNVKERDVNENPSEASKTVSSILPKKEKLMNASGPSAESCDKQRIGETKVKDETLENLQELSSSDWKVRDKCLVRISASEKMVEGVIKKIHSPGNYIVVIPHSKVGNWAIEVNEKDMFPTSKDIKLEAESSTSKEPSSSNWKEGDNCMLRLSSTQEMVEGVVTLKRVCSPGKYFVEILGSKGNNKAIEVEDKDMFPVTKYVLNQVIMALRDVDNTESWEEATVHEILSPHLYIVHYTRDGAFNGVPRDAMKTLPSPEETVERTGQYQDENVWMVGDLVLAMWSEDNVWYKAAIIAIHPHGCYTVNFIDYGNSDTVSASNIVSSVDSIPDGSLIDVNIGKDNGDHSRKVVVNTELESEIERLTVTVDNLNMNDAYANKNVKEAEKKPPKALQCDLCGQLVSRAMRLECNRTPVCWACAVKRITGSHQCWVCTEIVTNASSHLVMDPKLRVDVETYAATNFYEDDESTPSAPIAADINPYQLVEPLDFSSMMKLDNGVNVLHATKLSTFFNVLDPAGITKLLDGRLLVCSTSTNSVLIINNQGVIDGKLKSGCLGSRDFFDPTDVILRKNGEVVVCDKKGLHLFDTELKFKKMIGKTFIDECYGLAEDEEGRILTIHRKTTDKQLPLETKPFYTYVLFIKIMEDIEDVVVKCIDMEEIKEAAVAEMMEVCAEPGTRLESQLRTITYKMGSLYITDLGLDCLFVVTDTTANMFGRRGKEGGEYRDPTDVVVDDVGNMLVLDSRNMRIQVINGETEFLGCLKVAGPLARPSRFYLDKEERELYICNKLSKNVLRCKL